jgi:hypothetical protein
MVYVLLLAIYRIWFLGALALIVYAIAELIFGAGSFSDRLRGLVPRVAVSIVWPLALLTPRGRYLLWTKWRNRQ